MATATEISTRALRRLGVIDSRQSANAGDIAAANDALNAMIASWESDWLSGDVLPLDARFEQAITAMLAVRLAEEYGKEPGQVLVRDAIEGWAKLQGAFFAVPASKFETALKYTGQGAVQSLIASTPVMGDAWRANTVYDARTTAVNGFNLYEVVTGGTSAASGGPTGNGTAIIDGTVTWVWRQVTA